MGPCWLLLSVLRVCIRSLLCPVHPTGEYMWDTFCHKHPIDSKFINIYNLYLFVNSTLCLLVIQFICSLILALSSLLSTSPAFCLDLIRCTNHCDKHEDYKRGQWKQSLFQILVFYSCWNMKHTTMLYHISKYLSYFVFFKIICSFNIFRNKTHARSKISEFLKIQSSTKKVRAINQNSKLSNSQCYRLVNATQGIHLSYRQTDRRTHSQKDG